MVNSQTINYLKIVPFSQFSLWDTKRYTSKLISSNYPIVKLGSCITEQSKKYKIFEQKEEDFGILGVNNKEGIFDAYTQKGAEINQPYKKMQTGWLAYNPYRINVGSIGIKLEEHKNEYISPAYVVFSCKENLLPEFLFYLFKTNTFNNVIKESTTGSVRQNLTFETLKNIDIPLPSIEEQLRIVSDYINKIEFSNLQDEQSKEIEDDIEKYIFNELGINIIKKNKDFRGLNLLKFSELNEWGVDKLLKGNNDILISNKFPNEKLSFLTNINPRTDISKLDGDSKMSFIPMECISDKYGDIIELKDGVKNNSSGYTKFQEDDLIWARITPCMQNGKSTIVKGLKNNFGYGSTEFHVLRSKKDIFLLEFAYHLLRTKAVRKDAANYFTGSAGQQRVPKSYLENLLVPVPPIENQIEICTKLNVMKKRVKELDLLFINSKNNAILDFENIIFNKL